MRERVSVERNVAVSHVSDCMRWNWILSYRDCSPATALRVLGVYLCRVMLSFIKLLIVVFL